MPAFLSRQHPWTKQFFTDDLRQIPFSRHKRKVYEKFMDFTGLSAREVSSAFRDGTEPYVELADTGPLYGYTPRDGTKIQLSVTFVEELEAILPSNRVPRGDVYAPSELE